MASVLMIAVTLALTTFGALSLASARADWEMSRKASALAMAWYEAEGRMQEQLARMDEQLAAGEAVFAQDEILKLTEPVQEGQELQVSLRLTAGGYEIVRYELVNTGGWNPENGLDIWEGARQDGIAD